MYYIVMYSSVDDGSDDFIPNRALAFNHSDSIIDFLCSNKVNNPKVYRVFPHKQGLPTITSLGKCKLADRLKDINIIC